MLYRIGYVLAVVANAVGLIGPVDRFGWWLHFTNRLPTLDAGIHEGIVRDWR